jgi:hypothetical protein
MGIIKESKASTAAQHASRAVREGRTVFLYRFNVAATSSGWSGPIAGAAEVIEAVERSGWQLNDFAYDGAQSQHGAVLMLFRRGPQQPPAPVPHPQGEIAPDRQIVASQNEYREQQIPQRPQYFEPPPAPGGYPTPEPGFDGQHSQRTAAPWPQGPAQGRPNGRHHDPRQHDY